MGAQWLSGRVLDSRPRGRGFEPHRRHSCGPGARHIYPSLVLVQHRKTLPYLTERLLMERKNQIKQTNPYVCHINPFNPNRHLFLVLGFMGGVVF